MIATYLNKKTFTPINYVNDIWANSTHIVSACAAASTTGKVPVYSYTEAGAMTHVSYSSTGGYSFGVSGNGEYCVHPGLYRVYSYRVYSTKFIHIDSYTIDNMWQWKPYCGANNRVYCARDKLLILNMDATGNLTLINESITPSARCVHSFVENDFEWLVVPNYDYANPINIYKIETPFAYTEFQSIVKPYISATQIVQSCYITKKWLVIGYEIAAGAGSISVYARKGDLTYEYKASTVTNCVVYGLYCTGSTLIASLYTDGLTTYAINGDGTLTQVENDDRGHQYGACFFTNNKLFVSGRDGAVMIYQILPPPVGAGSVFYGPFQGPFRGPF